MTYLSIKKFFVIFLCLTPFTAFASNELIGDWSLQMDSGTPAWMSIHKTDGNWDIRMRLYVGSDGPHTDVTMTDERLAFRIRQNKKSTHAKTVNVGLINGSLASFPTRPVFVSEVFMVNTSETILPFGI